MTSNILTYVPQTNRFRGGGKSYRPDKLAIGEAKRVFPTVIIDGEEIDNIARQLSMLPAGADGIVVWPYDTREHAKNPAEMNMVRVAPYRLKKEE